MAAGVAALVWTVRPCLPPRQVRQYLFYGCEDLGDPGNDEVWGWGRVDSYASVSGVFYTPSPDCDADGTPDECEWPRPCRGDLDGDCDIDLSDLAHLLGHYGATSAVAYKDGDLNRDGTINLVDLAVLLANYGTDCP
jgi:hypothetical protein